jgi:hypothetical protein
MPPLPRGICPECRTDVALRNGGKVREHHLRYVEPPAAKEPGWVRCGPFAYGATVCAGSGKQAVKP